MVYYKGFDLISTYDKKISHPIVDERNKTIVPLEYGTIEAIDFSSFNVPKEDSRFKEYFFIGEKYSLKAPSCEGFEMKEKIYQLIGVVNNFSDVPINSVIMKQISGEKDLIFALSKSDCLHLGIEYEPELQLFPQDMSWNRVVENFDKDDLSTTPKSEIDNKIRYFLLKLKGFKDYKHGFIVSPSGKLFDENELEKRLYAKAIEPIVFGNGHIHQEGVYFNTKIVRPNHVLFNHGNDISSEDEIYLQVDLIANDENENDGFSGVDPKYLSGLSLKDVLCIYLDETDLLSLEDYEEKKKKEKQERLAAAKREKELKEKIAKEQKRINDEALKRMLDYEIVDKLIYSKMYENCQCLTTNNSYYDAFDNFEKELYLLNDRIESLKYYMRGMT